MNHHLKYRQHNISPFISHHIPTNSSKLSFNSMKRHPVAILPFCSNPALLYRYILQWKMQWQSFSPAFETYSQPELGDDFPAPSLSSSQHPPPLVRTIPLDMVSLSTAERPPSHVRYSLWMSLHLGLLSHQALMCFFAKRGRKYSVTQSSQVNLDQLLQVLFLLSTLSINSLGSSLTWSSRMITTLITSGIAKSIQQIKNKGTIFHTN